MTELLENSPVSAGEDDVRQYLNEIRRYPRLTPEEERELAMRCARGDESAIRQIPICGWWCPLQESTPDGALR